MDLNEILKNKKTAAITGHVRPDGDATGSCLALYLYIRKNFPDTEVDVYLEETDPAFYYLKGIDSVKHEPDDNIKYDIFFVLDCANIDRIKPFASIFYAAGIRACIDHHVSSEGDFAEYNKIEPDASSTCEVLYGILDKDKIDKDIATCLYTGLIHDTGVFKYESTSPGTMVMAAELMKFGFDFTKIIDESFYSRSFEAGKALGIALEKAEFFCEGYGIYSFLTEKDLKNSGAGKQDLGGIVEQLRLTGGAELAVFIYPADGEKKISLRSKREVDVAAYAKSRDGGGHVRAAGFSSDKDYDEIIKDICIYATECRKNKA